MPTGSPLPYGPKQAVLVVAGRIDGVSIPALCKRLVSLVELSGAWQVTCDVAALESCDLVAIDALARLALVARALGCEVRLRHPSDRLVELIAFAGLEERLGLSGQDESSVRDPAAWLPP